MGDSGHPDGAKNRILLLVAGFICLAAMVALLFVTADTTPTTPTTRRLFGLWRVRSVLPALVLLLAGIGFILAARSRILAYLSSILAMTATFALLEGAGLAGLVSWGELFKPHGDQLGRHGAVRAANEDTTGITYQDTAYAWGIPSDPIPFHFRSDRHGFRNAEDRATADTILLGDSTVVGALVPFEKTVTAVLEGKIGRPVMQVALIGLSPQEEHDLLWQTGLDLRGRHVIQFIFEGNDLLDSRRYRLNKAMGEAAAEPRTLLLNEIWNVLTRITDRSNKPQNMRTCFIGEQIYTFLWGRPSFEGLEGEFKEVAASLETFANQVRKAGGRYSAVFVPDKIRVLADLCTFPSSSAIKDPKTEVGTFREDMIAWGEKSGVAVFDLTGPLKRAATSGRIPWFWGDTHWNDVGHQEAGSALADWPALRESEPPQLID